MVLYTLFWRWTGLVGRWRLPVPLMRYAVLPLLMSIASPAAWAQTYYPINQPGTITFGNFTFTLGSCSYQLNNGGATNCNNDDIEVSVTTSRNSLTLTYVNSTNTSAALFTQATANGCTCLQYELTVSNVSG